MRRQLASGTWLRPRPRQWRRTKATAVSEEVFEARVLSNQAPAAREGQSAHGKRKMPARAQQKRNPVKSHAPLVDLDLQRAIERSLIDIS